MLAGPHESLQVVASSSEAMRVLEVFELQAQEGPCLDCYRTGLAVQNQTLASADQWPRFAPEALRRGFASVLALPLRLRGETIGALNVFNVHEAGLGSDDLMALQALADVATLAIVQYRTAMNAQALNEQLADALNSRVLIE
jgi:GAF domain-containing protein